MDLASIRRDHVRLRQHPRPGRPGRAPAGGRGNRARPSWSGSARSRSTSLPVDLGGGARAASSARRCRSSARWTSRTASCGSSPASAGCRHRPADERWDQAARGALVGAGRRSAGRSRCTAPRSSRVVPADPTVERIARAALARYATLAILSNWPLAATIDRYAEAAGWSPHLTAIVVSQRVGTIKPHPAIFAEARRLLGGPEPRCDPPRRGRLGGGRRRRSSGRLARGVRPARGRDDSPLPASERDDTVVADLEIDAVAAAGRPASRTSAARPAAIGHSPHWASRAPRCEDATQTG